LNASILKPFGGCHCCGNAHISELSETLTWLVARRYVEQDCVLTRLCLDRYGMHSVLCFWLLIISRRVL